MSLSKLLKFNPSFKKCCRMESRTLGENKKRPSEIRNYSERRNLKKNRPSSVYISQAHEISRTWKIASRMTPLIIYHGEHLTDECTGYFAEIFSSTLFFVSLPTDVTSRRRHKKKNNSWRSCAKEAPLLREIDTRTSSRASSSSMLESPSRERKTRE